MVWNECTENESDILEAAKIATGAIKGTSKHRLALGRNEVEKACL